MEEEIKLNLDAPKANYDDEANKETTSGNKAAIILSYLSSWLGGLLVFLLKNKISSSNGMPCKV